MLPHQVPRPHLLLRLNQGLSLGHSLTLIVAPAGFGKTSLVSQWIANRGVATTALLPISNIQHPKFCWLSLDTYDNDLTLFLHYVVATIQAEFPAACANTQHLLQAPQLVPVHHLTTTLLQDLAALEEPCVLVLEDYHLIVESVIHQALTQLLDRLPRHIHLVLISRTDPPLPLARLRVRQQMTELRVADLCFSDAEAHTFLMQALGKPPTRETVATLQAQTEGWIAGLQLAALALRGRADETAVMQTIATNNRHIMDYLMEEVLAHQPRAVQQFLMRTAIFERFCAPLCEAILGGSEEVEERSPLLPHAQTASQSILTYLVQSNLFVIPLDNQDEWYRYHHLFRALLHHHLHLHKSAAEIAALHCQASAWLAAKGWVEEAIQHALAGGDEQTAAQLVAQPRHELLNHEAWYTLARRLALLSEALIQQDATLLVTKAWVLSIQFKLAAIPPLLQAASAHQHAHALSETDVQSFQGELGCLWAQCWYWQNEAQLSLTAAQQSLVHLPKTYLYARSGSLFYLGLASHMLGQSAAAIQTLQATLEAHQAYSNTFVARIFFAMTMMHYLTGALTRMHQTAQDFLQVATQDNLTLTMAWAHYLLGVVHYEWNELETAAQHFAVLVDLRYSVNTLAVHNGWLGLAWIQQVQGDPDLAQQQVAALLRFHHEMHNLAFLPLIYSFQARLALQQAKRAAALDWAQAMNLGPAREPIITFELPQLTRVKSLVAQGTAPLMAEARADLEQLRRNAEATHNTMRLIEILALQALIEAGQGQTKAALNTLQRAVTLAKPGRFIRTFVDLGTPLAGLLYQLATRGVETSYIGQILAAFPLSTDIADPAQQIRRAAQARLIEPLTERESEILLHLAQELPNKAIARVLNISTLTVKKHTIHLYQKLEVKSRQQAVARARALGILALATKGTNLAVD